MKAKSLLEQRAGVRCAPSYSSGELRSTAEFERLLEWVGLLAACIKNNLSFIENHLGTLRGRGETEKRLQALHNWRQSIDFTEREKAALSLGEAILLRESKVPSGATLEEAQRHFSNAELIRLMLTVMGESHRIDFAEKEGGRPGERAKEG